MDWTHLVGILSGVCSGAKLNDLLALQIKNSPASLSYSDNAGNQITADFDDWKIVDGGSDKKLHMELPIKTGQLTTLTSSTKLDGASVIVSIQLAFIDDAKAQKSRPQIQPEGCRQGPERQKQTAVFTS